MNTPIAIVGMACVYPDANSPLELWENVLAQRRAFRRIPPERLNMEDYYSSDREASDKTYCFEAAVIEGYVFDRVAFRVMGSTFRSADLAHWLALDVAAKALIDAGFPDADRLPRETTGVLLGNTLTGEFSRANILRLRWPFARRILDAALRGQGWPPARRSSFLESIETQFKAPFPPIGEESLAGGLSNTIAGRVCNQWDLKGGGYTLDGACASSLLAIANACSALAAGDMDAALAGGVDLSLDPFELVGFAKAGALAADEMRIYDARSSGFWPGEGCGWVVLMRLADALAQNKRIYATIRGWGISSDGRGGITRPEMDGQVQALRRAYRRAGFGIDTVSYCEGHGTGTPVGDEVELKVLSHARREVNPLAPAAAIGSIKANIGHAKAAAGVAGLIKTALAVYNGILPPTTSCGQPRSELEGAGAVLRVLKEPELWPAGRPLRASVSAMGFGGVNAHLALEGNEQRRRTAFTAGEEALSCSAQDAEIFLFETASRFGLLEQTEQVARLARSLSRSELVDLSAELAKRLDHGGCRAAVTASTPAELADKLALLKSCLESPQTGLGEPASGVYCGFHKATPVIGFLFPGQGSPIYLDGGLHERRFPFVRDLYKRFALPQKRDGHSTEIAQPAIVAASLAGLAVLSRMGIVGDLAVGHSLGELTACQWAGACNADTIMELARIRGKAMAELGSPTGAMAAIEASSEEVSRLIDGGMAIIAGYNSPRQTVVSGESNAVAVVMTKAQANGYHAVRLPVSHAFHTPMVAGAVKVLEEHLQRTPFQPLHGIVFSTVTGARLKRGENLAALLCRQVTSPVRFMEAISAACKPDCSGRTECVESAGAQPDLWIEVGPGQVLCGLAKDFSAAPVMSMDAGGQSMRGLLNTVGAAFCMGASVQWAPLFAGRFSRRFNPAWHPRFFTNPCEMAPLAAKLPDKTKEGDDVAPPPPVASIPDTEILGALDRPAQTPPVVNQTHATLEYLRSRVAQRAELPLEAVKNDDRFLGNLHLNSITVSQLVAETARHLGLPPLKTLTDFANATIAEAASALDALCRQPHAKPDDDPRQPPAGVDAWVRPFVVEWVKQALPPRSKETRGDRGRWKVFALDDEPLAQQLRVALAQTGCAGVLVCLPELPDENHASLLLEAAGSALASSEQTRFCLVQQGWGAGGFARSLYLETPAIPTAVINIPKNHPQAVEWVLKEALSVEGFVEMNYDGNGDRWVPRLKLLTPEDDTSIPFLSRDDVLLATGGGKGIAAECALNLAKTTGARLVLLGRSHPQQDAELARNLARMDAAGARWCYEPADVCDAQAVALAVHRAQSKFGPITALLHGAGANEPRSLKTLDEATFFRTLAPKVAGLRNVLAAIDPLGLRHLISFGSIIARSGFPGEAHYAVANEWQTCLVEQFAAQHPDCHCVALEWSLWSGIGMGQRLGRVEAMAQGGITPIAPDEGSRLLADLLQRRMPAVAVVVTGRFGTPPTLGLGKSDLPLWRFIERPRVYYPGVELVVDVRLSSSADPYVNDHIFHGQRLFPAVMGLEAVAQAAMVLADIPGTPVFEDVKFLRALVVPDAASVTIRIAALRLDAHRVELAVRSEETGFQTDHFRAVCRFGSAPLSTVQRLDMLSCDGDRATLDPNRDLYGRLLFHSGRFCRLLGYRRLTARECVAEISPGDRSGWFGGYLPSDLVLGDPAARDAAVHAIQACIPHARVLPVGIDRLIIHDASSWSHKWVRALERQRQGDDFVYDATVTDMKGRVLEEWAGLRLRVTEPIPPPDVWIEPLLAPYMGRRLQELLKSPLVGVALERNGNPQRSIGSDLAINHALGACEPVWRRPDGKPEVMSHDSVSAAHAGDLVLAVSCRGLLGCDIEKVEDRPQKVWRDLLGRDRAGLVDRIGVESAENFNQAATRVWVAVECLKKAGVSPDTPLLLDSTLTDGWLIFRAAALSVATLAASLRGGNGRIVAGVALENRDREGSHPFLGSQ